ASFFEIQNKRAAPLMEINGEEKRLQEELRRLRADEQSIRQLETRAKLIEDGLPELRGNVESIQAQQGRRGALEEELALKRQRIGELTAENTRLRAEMNDLKERIDSLKQVDGADCPLCGKPLSESERQNLLSDLEAEGRQKGDLYRENVAQQKRDEESLKELQAELTALTRLDQQLLTEHRKLDQAETELKRLRDTLETWEASGAMRLLDLEEQITKGMFALDARSRLAAIDQEARSLGYDAAAHDAVRASEQAGRGAELALRELESARAALEPLERQLDGLGRQIELDRVQQAQQEQEYTAASQKYATEAAALPDLNLVERELLHAQSEENRLRMDVGMVRQLVAVLDSLRERKARQVKRRSDLMVTITRLKALERAFSKDGVPALLIEQALPDIEAHANDLLERLSAGGMSVRFATQRALKSKKEEMRETLDIIISDSFGERPYEMFSGGEAFRVNFAIRLALSRVLAHRAGARLQTLFIDEGFGSQDAEGRQRLLEAISLVQTEFERILVITHLEELKEAFPARIEVEKTQRGSSLKVVL
ncbi:MAG: SMC family ATPase, partial [Anaerolineae bacterium]|nr:SMC family ATPase [Anaerolineae bacterium]